MADTKTNFDFISNLCRSFDVFYTDHFLSDLADKIKFDYSQESIKKWFFILNMPVTFNEVFLPEELFKRNF